MSCYGVIGVNFPKYLLSKGFKHSLKPVINSKSIQNLAVETELALIKSKNNTIENKCLAKSKLLKYSAYPIDHKTPNAKLLNQ